MKTSKGFTLIELAIVVAIIAVLAAVAVPKFGNAEASAERAVIKDMVSQLTSAAAIYTARYSRTPGSFTDFVKPTEALAAGDPQTISTAGFGAGNCTVPGPTVTCTDTTFKKWKAPIYTYADGVITVNAPDGQSGNRDQF